MRTRAQAREALDRFVFPREIQDKISAFVGFPTFHVRRLLQRGRLGREKQALCEAIKAFRNGVRPSPDVDFYLVKDKMDKFYVSSVVASKGGLFKIHFEGWDERWDEWVKQLDIIPIVGVERLWRDVKLLNYMRGGLVQLNEHAPILYLSSLRIARRRKERHGSRGMPCRCVLCYKKGKRQRIY